MLPPASAARLSSLLDSITRSTPLDYANQLAIPTSDLPSLTDSQFLEPANPLATPTTLVSYFSVAEVDKHRRRPIVWPRDYLATSDYNWPSTLSLGTVAKYRSLVLAGSTAVAFDLAASFWQIPLPPSSFLAARCGQELFRVTRLPYGIDCASEILQLTLEGIAPTIAGITHVVHIDNIVAVGEPAAVCLWRSLFLQRCALLNITLNCEEANTPSSSLTFAGLSLDFQRKTASLPPRKVTSLLSDWNVDGERTHAHLERLMGRIFYAAAVLGMSLVPFYFLIKWWRRCLSALAKGHLAWHTAANIPPHAKRDIDTLSQIIANNTPSVVTAEPLALLDAPEVVVCSDATLTGFGGVLLRECHEPASFGARFATPLTSIAIAEASALLAAVTAFASDIRGRRVLLLVDNTSVLHACRRPTKACLELRSVVDRLRARLTELHITARICHVTSETNPADAPSRGRPLDLTLVDQVVHHFLSPDGSSPP